MLTLKQGIFGLASPYKRLLKANCSLSRSSKYIGVEFTPFAPH